jgi:hypothetical protein
MPGCTSVPSVDVAASPECNVLITVTSLHYLYVCIECSVRSLDFDKSEKQEPQHALFGVGGVFRVAVRPKQALRLCQLLPKRQMSR